MAIRTVDEVRDTLATKQHYLQVQSTKIFVYERGQGMPILFLHGSPDTHEMWLPLINHLGDNFHAIAIDLPGFGESSLHESFSLTLDHMADFVRDLIEALHIEEPVTLVTTDFGGHYGLAFMTKYPETVRGVTISNTNFFSDYQWHFFAQLYRVPIIGEILVNTATRNMMRQTLKSVAPALPEHYIESSYDSGFGSASVRKTILRMYRERSSEDFREWEDQILTILQDKPALVLWSDQDPFITPDYGDRWGNAQVHHFEDYSHWLPVEAPEKYGDILRQWLEELPQEL